MAFGLAMRALLALLVLALPLSVLQAQEISWPDYTLEPPSLLRAIDDGNLPPLAQRLPTPPRVINVKARGGEPGRYGGTWRMLMGDQRDIRSCSAPQSRTCSILISAPSLSGSA